MWGAVALGLIKAIPAIINLVEGAVKRGPDGEPAGARKLDAAVGITTLILNQALPQGVGLTTRQREAIIGAINANVELANAFKDD